MAKDNNLRMPESCQAGSGLQDWFRDIPFSPEMVIVPAGTFFMGSDVGQGRSNERPRREVSVRSFAISRFTITFDEWDYYTRHSEERYIPSDEGWGRGNQPAINISWQDAQAYTLWLSNQTGYNYRLPSEAEWEYMALAGSNTDFSWGNAIGPEKANYEYNAGRPSPVETYLPNAWGIFNAQGNVWEWCADCWHNDYLNAPCDGQAWLEEDDGISDIRVLRGGSWASDVQFLRTRNRYWSTPDTRLGVFGVRVVREL